MPLQSRFRSIDIGRKGSPMPKHIAENRFLMYGLPRKNEFSSLEVNKR